MRTLGRMDTCPEVESSSPERIFRKVDLPAMAFRVVDLPAPLAPMIP